MIRLQGDVNAMNACMNRAALTVISYFDGRKELLPQEPGRFYHGYAFEGKTVLIGEV